MFAFITESLTSLLLAGVLVYVVLTRPSLKNRKFVQQAVLGSIFGVMVIFLANQATRIEPFLMPLDFRAGLSIFAGYLGGPIGAIIAGLCGAGFRYVIGGPEIEIGIFMNLGIPAVGLAVSYLRPLKNWPDTRQSPVGYLVLGFALLHIPPYIYYASTSILENPDVVMPLVAAGYIVSGVVSILITWQILNYAFRFANDANHAAELARRLDLARTASGVGLYVKDIGENDLFYDAGMIAIFGLDRDPGPIPLCDVEAALNSEDLQRERDAMEQCWAKGKYQGNANFRATRADGEQRFIRTTWVAEPDTNGVVKRVMGMSVDLTDIREAKQQSQNSRHRLATVAEKLPGAIVELDATDWFNPEFLYISPKCLDIWGYTDQELIADTGLFAKMHDLDDLVTFLKTSKKSFEAGESLYYRHMITARDGKIKWLDHHGGSLIKDGRIIVTAIVLDATHEVELQQRIENEREIARRAQKNESIGQLTGGVAHDFNNLLAVILGNLELLSEDDDPAAQKEMIDAAITATLRGADLTKNMLAFARQAPLNSQVLDLNKVVREAKNWMARAFPASIVVQTSLLAGLWPIETDRASLESALLNLGLNARDAMAGQGNLTIETANVRIDEAYVDNRKEELPPGRYVMLAVSDTGTGISNAVLGSIFEPFFTTKPPGSGSGLGLSMTVGFMRQSGGTVQVYTEVGQGTTFKLYFPAADATSEQRAVPVRDEFHATGSDTRLLLAEDEDDVRKTLVAILERAGYQVTATASGDEAFAVFEANPTFDLLLTDIVMPGILQGTGLAKELRLRGPDLPVLFMSGYASEATVHGNGLRPEDIRLMKPVQRVDLLAAVAAALKIAST
ncbi:ATP-binding protein [Sulfitobacter sp.]|uniref:ATP-binding protein n=1 Tax=Sulfitobacter sp. TaxID=1903071 RepID=UPI003000FB61